MSVIVQRPRRRRLLKMELSKTSLPNLQFFWWVARCCCCCCCFVNQDMARTPRDAAVGIGLRVVARCCCCCFWFDASIAAAATAVVDAQWIGIVLTDRLISSESSYIFLSLLLIAVYTVVAEILFEIEPIIPQRDSQSICPRCCRQFKFTAGAPSTGWTGWDGLGWVVRQSSVFSLLLRLRLNRYRYNFHISISFNRLITETSFVLLPYQPSKVSRNKDRG